MSSDAPIKSSQICRACGHLVPMELYAEARGGGKVTVCNPCLNEWDLDYRKKRLRQKARSAARMPSHNESDSVSRDEEAAAAAATRVSATLRKDVDEIVGGLTNREIASFIDRSKGLGISFWDVLDHWKRCGGLCDVCGRRLLIIFPPGSNRAKVGEVARYDHDHVDGRVRGVLCAECNIHTIPGYELAVRCGLDKVQAYLSAGADIDHAARDSVFGRSAMNREDIMSAIPGVTYAEAGSIRLRAYSRKVNVWTVVNFWKRCGGMCELCGRRIFLSRCSVPEGSSGMACCDHDHANGRIRGFLCLVCNVTVVPGYESAIRIGEDKIRAYLGMGVNDLLPSGRVPFLGDKAVGHTGENKLPATCSNYAVSIAIHRLLGDWTVGNRK